MKYLDIHVSVDQRDIKYFDIFRNMYENIVSFFEENNIPLPKYIQPYKAFMCAYKFSELQKLYSSGVYVNELKVIVRSFYATTQNTKTNFYYVDKLGTQPNVAKDVNVFNCDFDDLSSLENIDSVTI